MRLAFSTSVCCNDEFLVCYCCKGQTTYLVQRNVRPVPWEKQLLLLQKVVRVQITLKADTQVTYSVRTVSPPALPAAHAAAGVIIFDKGPAMNTCGY